MTSDTFDAVCKPCESAEFRKVYAWHNTMPLGPATTIVIGDVKVSNPGIDPILVEPAAPGINPTILTLDLLMCKKPGVWPRVFVWKSFRFDQPMVSDYTTLEIRCGSDTAVSVPIDTVS